MRGKLRTTLDSVERELIVEALKSARGNMAEAARKLGISERIMGLRVVRFRVDLEKLRRASSGG
jgi:Nif-specific regulatory protein